MAFVVQRYGAGITGGSESLAKAVAERLAGEDEITVFTTCARDYVTWRNELPEGTAREGAVEVRRFTVAEERDLASFNALSDALYAREHTDEEERLWLRRQGPYVPALVDALERARGDFDAFAFFTYLYYPTCEGLARVGERSILVPTAHDEPPLRFRLYERVFAAPRGFAFCSAPEEALVRARFDLGSRPSEVTGVGVEEGLAPDVEAFRIRHDVGGPFAIYAGRIDAGKGCAEMLEFYERYRQDVRGAAELVLLGRLAMPEPRVPGVRYLGFLPEAEKRAALGGASAVVCPSPYESLSIVLLEGLALGTPALANARSPVLKHHCVRSNAGLFYETADEFAESLDLLVRRGDLRQALGAQGRRYVEEHYRWPAVLERYRRLIEAVARA